MQLFVQALQHVTLGDDAERLFHGRGGMFAGCEHLCLDWFPPVLLLTSFKAIDEDEINVLTTAITQRWLQLKGQEPLNLVFQHRCGGQTETQLLQGAVPEPHYVTENGAQFQVHLLRGQNHGLFLDMRAGRAWVKQHAKQCKVLNLFAYTCGFSVMALQGGADEVVNIDMSKGALSIGKQNHLHNGLAHGARFLGHDIFKSWGKLTKFGPYDLIIADPPSNQRGSFVATKDYARLLRRLPSLLAEQGDILLCLNAPELDIDFLMQQVAEHSPDLIFIEQLANPEVYCDKDPNKALKVLRYQHKRDMDSTVTV
ncbi:class I SAM-dependent methyltransferase [Shewanella algidipiscicola]|uniref:S-adenosylmethionine-dependent methyltransferase n=1 Tax=Shewanella algidipiscicola TaxID=614070 RepID=A0ABQ4PNY9_9GAMM|nr:class I SAM-dependent methyltransferase [Shewanella algidipiscicola]GIU50289.1 S-adenosylmethionine-dependent methyltransferase [Shewanella algidipiscicola]